MFNSVHAAAGLTIPDDAQLSQSELNVNWFILKCLHLVDVRINTIRGLKVENAEKCSLIKGNI